MAKLPNIDRAVIAREKIVDYLLSHDHPDGWGKARYFAGHGFTVEHWRELDEALRAHAREHDVIEEIDTLYGKKYIIDGPMASPKGRTGSVRAVWRIETDESVPRFVTAFRRTKVKRK